MATFTRIQGNLTADDAREVGRGTSFQEADYYLDGKEPVHVTVVVPAEDAEDVPEGQKRRAVRLGSLLNAEEIAQDVSDHEKASLLAKKKAGAIESSIRDRPNAPGGQTWEWDHWQFSLSRDETAWLAANSDKEAEFKEIVAEAMRLHPSASGTRQALITDIHKDSGAWHIQGLVSRYAMDYGVKPPRASTAVDMSNNSAAAELIRRMQDRFNDAGMPFNVGRLYTNEKAADGQPRSKFEDRNTSDAAKEAYRQDVQSAGGVPGARSTVGIEPESPATSRAITSISPEVEKLELGARLAEDDGLKAAQRVIALQAELQAAEAARQAAAERRATFDQAIAAIGQKMEADAAALAAKAAQEAAEQALEAARVDAAAKAAQAELEAAQAAQELLQEQDRADIAGRLASARFTEIEAMTAEVSGLKQEIEGEPVRQAEAVADSVNPLNFEIQRINTLLEAETKARQTAEEDLAEEKRTFPERARKWAEENVLAPARAKWEAEIAKPIRQQLEDAKASVATVQTEIAGIPDRVKKAVSDAEEAARADFEAKIAAPLRKQLEDLNTEMKQVKEDLRKAVNSMAGILLQMAAAPVQAVANIAGAVAERAEAVAQVASQTAEAVSSGGNASRTYFKKLPAEWSDAEREVAKERLDAAQKQNSAPQDMTIDEWAERQHNRWNERQEAKKNKKFDG